MGAASGYIQYLHESAPNGETGANAVSAVEATSYLPAVEWQWKMDAQLADRSNELRGISDPLFPDIVGFNPGEHTCTMNLYADYIGVFLTNALGAGTYTAGDGSAVKDPDNVTMPVGTNRWVWTSNSLPVLPKTAQITLAYPDEAVFWKFQGAGCDQIKLAVGQQGNFSQATITHKSLYGVRIANPSLTPAYDAATIKPFLRANHTVPTWPSSGTNIDDIEYTLDTPVVLDWSLGGSRWPDLIDRDGVGQKLSGQIKLRYTTVTDWDQYINNTAFTVLSKWVSTQFITGSYPYKLYIQAKAVYTGGDVDSLKRAVKLGQTIPFQAGYDATQTYAFKITLCNGITTYSSV